MMDPALTGLDFEALFNALPGAFLVLDGDYRVVAANDRYLLSLGGAKRERMIGRALFELMPTDVSPEAKVAFDELRASFERVMTSGESETLPAQPYEVRRPKGEGGGIRRGHLSVINTALRDRDGVVRWLIHRVQDVTETQSAIARLDQSEHHRRLIESRHAVALAASGLGAWDYDRPNQALNWDAQATSLLGLGPNPEPPPTFAEFVALVHPDDRGPLREHVDDILRGNGKEELAVTFRLMGAHGALGVWLEARGRATFVEGACVRVSGVLADVTTRQRYESHLRLLINELNHRVKNTLAVVQSIAMQTLRDDAPSATARADFIDRLMALAFAHDILTRENWEGADLAAVVERVLAPHRSADATRIAMEGPTVRVSPRVALSLAMALHELATNAAKYGALSGKAGQVSVIWSLETPAPDSGLRVAWTERGGPAAMAPTSKGFGMRLLERVLAKDIEGVVELDFAQEGLTCAVCAPASVWRSASAPQPLGTV